MKKRSVDYGRIVFTLVLIIVLIFVFDTVRRFMRRNNTEYNYDCTSYVVANAGTDKKKSEDKEDKEVSKAPSPDFKADDYDKVSVSEDDLYKGTLILVNSDNAYKGSGELSSFQDKKSKSYRIRDYSLLMDSDAIDSLNKMLDDFSASSGLSNIMLYSTNEHHDMSSCLYTQSLPERATGLCADVAILGESSTSLLSSDEPYNWILENCWSYGYVVRYPSEKSEITGEEGQPWHLRYVGLPHSEIMNEKDICLEEYLDMLKSDYTYDASHLEFSGGEIYYAPSGSEVYVPKGSKYDISGNNSDGFIITAYSGGSSDDSESSGNDSSSDSSEDGAG